MSGRVEEPGAEPPGDKWKAADDPIEEQQDGCADDESQSEGFAQIGEPSGPTLDADAVTAAHMVAIEVERKIGQGDENKKNREEDQPLQPTRAKELLCPTSSEGGRA